MNNPNPTQPAADLAKLARLARLKQSLRRHQVTQIAVAERAGVTKVHVCNVLAGRDDSAKVVRAAKDLVAEAIQAKRETAPALVR